MGSRITQKVEKSRLDFMRRYAEAVLTTAAKEEGINIMLAPEEIRSAVDDSDCTPHKVQRENTGRDTEYLRVDMAYRDQDGFDAERAERLAARFRSEFEELDFPLCGGGHGVGRPPGFDSRFPKGFPNGASVDISGSLQDIYAQAKNTALGRDIEQGSPAQGADK